MEFKLDAHLEYQLRAIQSVVDLFDGHPRTEVTFTLDQIGIQPNVLALEPDKLLANLRRVQERNSLPVDEELAFIEEATEDLGLIRFANFTLEMETGTGKTYVYLRTALELYARYGFRKFIVVVPSVAVREGVLKSLEIVEKHFRTLYQNPPLRYYVYDSSKLSQVRTFAQSDGLEIMIMTIQSFQAENVVLRQERDQLQGDKPIRLIQATRPVLILDEPQNMESEDRIRALAYLNPLFALRYSATHRSVYNLVYRLTPLDAYRLGLVKKIEVAGLVEHGSNRPYIRLDAVQVDRRTLKAKLLVDKLLRSSVLKRGVVTVRPGDNLEEKTGHVAYRGYIVEEIGSGFVRFTPGLELMEGQEVGPDKEAIFRAQIRYTIREHFQKQRRLRGKGIKVLSLFFLDRVASYVNEDGNNGIALHLFRQEFNNLKKEFPEWATLEPDLTQTAYFAQKISKKGCKVTYFEEESSNDARAAFKEAYELIMRSKERLLSFEEPVCFIFSHSALREGWDNPNIFQICTLNQTASVIRKRQEIGRGIRLCVNQNGERVFDRHYNVLTVVTNESYQDYVSKLQTEYREDLGDAAHGPKPGNALDRTHEECRRSKDLTDPAFLEIWEKIKDKTRYVLTVDSDKLIQDVVAELNQEQVSPPAIEVTKAVVDIEGDALTAKLVTAPKVYGETSRPPFPNLFEVIDNLMKHSSPPIRVTRRTLLDILRRTTNQQGMLKNPQAFAAALVRILREALADQLVDGIRYEKTGCWYEASQIFLDEFMAYADRIKRQTADGKPLSKSMYDGIEVESDFENRFADELEGNPEIEFYVKLPSRFKIPTPIGAYNPDWAIVLQERDPHGNLIAHRLYFIQETKETSRESELRSNDERRKVVCGRAHFRSLGVPYRVGPTLKDSR